MSAPRSRARRGGGDGGDAAAAGDKSALDEAVAAVRMVAAADYRAGRPTRDRTPMQLPTPAPPAASVTTSTGGSSASRKRSGKSASAPVVVTEKVEPELFASLRAAWRAIQRNDPHELQRILTPNIVKLPKEQWLDLTPAQLQEHVGQTTVDFHRCAQAAFDLPVEVEHPPTTLLHMAARCKSIPCMDVLLRNGFDVNTGDAHKTLALDESVKQSHLDGIDFLLFKGIKLNNVDKLGQTVLHTACRASSLTVVKRLVEGNMALNEQDRRGFTPLFWVLDNEDKPAGLEIAVYLHDQGGDPTIRDKEGVSIVHWCMSSLLQFYGTFCHERDHFSARELVEPPFREAASRLDLLEYLLTLDELPIDEIGRWRDRVTGVVHEKDALDYALDYVRDDEAEQLALIERDKEEKRQDELRASRQNKKLAGKKKRGASAIQPHGGADDAVGQQLSSASAVGGGGDVKAEDAMADAAPSPVGDATAAAATSPSAPLDDAASPTAQPRSPKRAKREYDVSAAQGSAASASTDPTSELASAAAAAAAVTECDEYGAPSTGPYVLSLDHFRPRLAKTTCKQCLHTYPEETIPEACARLVFMEMLRRATNSGDFGDWDRIQYLLKKREAHKCLHRSKLVYHRHAHMPIRVGPAHVACSYVDEGCQDYRILRSLLNGAEGGVVDRTVDPKGFSALHVVSELGDARAVKILLEAGFDPNMPGARERDTCLMLCSDSLDHGAEVASLLLLAGARRHTRDLWQNTAFHWAVYKGNMGVLRELLKGGRIGATKYKKNPHRADYLYEAGGGGDEAAADPAAATDDDASIDPLTAANHWGNTVMHYACYKSFSTEGHIQCLRELLLNQHLSIRSPPNLSGLVPRQVVAGYGAPDGRGARTLILLNTRRFVPEPLGELIEKQKGKIKPLTAEIEALVEREKAMTAPSTAAAAAAAAGSTTTTAAAAVSASSKDRVSLQAELRRKQKQWREYDAELTRLEAESLAKLRAILEKFDPRDLQLAYEHQKGEEGEEGAEDAEGHLVIEGKRTKKPSSKLVEAKEAEAAMEDDAAAGGELAAATKKVGADLTSPKPRGRPSAAAAAAAKLARPSSSSSASFSALVQSKSASPASVPSASSDVAPPPCFTQSDISRGREWVPIPLENNVDPPELAGGLDYKYITHCLPHKDITFPLPRVLSAAWQGRRGEEGGASTGATSLVPRKLNAAQQAEGRKFKEKQKARAAAKAAKERGGQRGRKGTGASKRGGAGDSRAASSPASSSSSSFVALQSSAITTQQQQQPSTSGGLGVDCGDDEDEAGPLCECTGPNACMDGSCPCFRHGNEKLVSHIVPLGEDAAASSSSSAGPPQSSSNNSTSMAGVDPVGRMGRLAGKLEALCNCHELCRCRSDCANRHLARGMAAKLVVYKTREKGWACRAAEFIRKGTFVVEYVGELVGAAEAARRLEDYDKRGIHYVFGFRHSPICIDPVHMGNVARTINHSCAPNLTKIQVYHSDLREGMRWPRMAFFASRDIHKGEELCISYDYEVQEHPGGCLVCYCNEPGCRHTLV